MKLTRNDDNDTGGASQGDPNDSLTEEDCREGSGRGHTPGIMS